MKCFTENDECKLWESGALRTDMPTESWNYVLLYNGEKLAYVEARSTGASSSHSYIVRWLLWLERS